MVDAPFISICIPAYKRVSYLNRLLQSIVIQDYKDFEVIVTDDSPDDSVLLLCKKYSTQLPLIYHSNTVALGTPGNWNKAISLAKGAWIKLMHDDDWFADSGSLQKFAECARKIGAGFIFSAYTNVFESGKKDVPFIPPKYRIARIKKNPSLLLAENLVGPPSTTMYKNDKAYPYDVELKWLVDIDMYIRRAQTDKVYYINDPLIRFYVSSTQVTSFTKNIGDVEIPEHFHVLNKIGVNKLRDISIYDYNWRLIRNFNIREVNDIRNFGYHGNIHPVIESVIVSQSKVPRVLLKFGTTSKALMLLHFIKHRKKIQ